MGSGPRWTRIMYLEETGREKGSSAQHEAMIINCWHFDVFSKRCCVQCPASQWTPMGQPRCRASKSGGGMDVGPPGLQGSSLQRPVQVGLAQLVVRHPLNHHIDKRGPCIQLFRDSSRAIKSRRTRRPLPNKTLAEPTRLTRILSLIQPSTLPQTDRTSPPTSSNDNDNVHVTTPEQPIDRPSQPSEPTPV